eukprot:522107_1
MIISESVLELSVLDDQQNMKHTINGKDIEGSTAMQNNGKYDADTYRECMLRNSKYHKKLGVRIAEHFRIPRSNMQILSAYPEQNKLNVNALNVNVVFRCNKYES